MLSQILSVVIFVEIVREKFPRHLVTLVAGGLTLVGVFLLSMQSLPAVLEALSLQSMAETTFWYTGHTAVNEMNTGINWSTIIFISGMMIMVEDMSEAGFFDWLCLRLAKLVNYRPVPLLVCFMILSAVLSMFIDSITVILFLAVASVRLAHLLHFDPIPLIIAEIFTANLGGAATMSGDPPNIIIGTALGLSFGDFLQNTGLIALVSMAVIVPYFYFCFRKDMKQVDEAARQRAMALEPRECIPNLRKFFVSVGIFVLTVVLLVTHAMTGLTVAMVGVIAAVLTLLNSYPLLVSQNMMVASNQNNLKSTAKVIESAMIGLEKLTVENVQAALEGLDESGAARIMVTNSAGLVLYDTRQGSNAVGEYALYSVVAVALRGQDASYCSYDGTAFLSRVATPVVYHNQIVGAVYAYDYDTEQSELLEAFRHNLLIISLLIALLVAGLSIVLSQMLTRQISGLLQAIRKVREGAYSHRADASGTDEIAQIAAEFNSLTDRLQTTENARRRFVSDASHELKTPLAGIRLLTDSILQTDHMDEETTKEFVTDIGREAERLSRITENLLRLTRLDSGVVQQPYPVAVRPVLERVERMLTMVAQEKGVTVSGAADEDAVALATDDDVHQILYNLMENAIKYSAAEDGFVRAEAHVDGDRVVLTVSDNGIGIPNEDLPHIFDRFYRVDKMRSREVGGTGLGLSIVKDTIENRGGTISAGHGANGVGTVFTVYLPLAERGEEA